MKLNYQQAYDRIVSAYFRDELDPWESCACFVGNLLGGKDLWGFGCTKDSIWVFRKPREYGIIFPEYDYMRNEAIKFINDFGYTAAQITALENCFIGIVGKIAHRRGEDFEDRLFTAMSSTLDMLKYIHIQNGEVIDNEPVFTKRQIQKA